MLSRILILLLVGQGLVGACHAADDRWYPKASDSCAQFLADVNSYAASIDPKLLRSPAFIRQLWSDDTILNLKRGLDALLNDGHDQNENSRVNAAIDSLSRILNLAMYCQNHMTMHLGDISALDIFNEIRGYPPAPNPTTTEEP